MAEHVSYYTNQSAGLDSLSTSFWFTALSAQVEGAAKNLLLRFKAMPSHIVRVPVRKKMLMVITSCTGPAIERELVETAIESVTLTAPQTVTSSFATGIKAVTSAKYPGYYFFEGELRLPNAEQIAAQIDQVYSKEKYLNDIKRLLREFISSKQSLGNVCHIP